MRTMKSKWTAVVLAVFVFAGFLLPAFQANVSATSPGELTDVDAAMTDTQEADAEEIEQNDDAVADENAAHEEPASDEELATEEPEATDAEVAESAEDAANDAEQETVSAEDVDVEAEETEDIPEEEAKDEPEKAAAETEQQESSAEEDNEEKSSEAEDVDSEKTDAEATSAETDEEPADVESNETAEEAEITPQAVDAIYLAGTNGDDAADGTTKETAVKTFARAKELAEADANITTIYVIESVNITADTAMSLDGTKAVIKRDPSFTGYLFYVKSGAVLTLSDITIDGNGDAGVDAKESLIELSGSQSTVNIEQGSVLKNNHIDVVTQSIPMGGAIYAGERTVINMTAGSIENNIAGHGGAVYLNQATFNMSGGTLTKNKALTSMGFSLGDDGNIPDIEPAGAGGAVILKGGSKFNMSGGSTISYNYSDEIGGGVSVGSMAWSDGSDRFNMEGGTIDSNTSGSTGAGVFVQVSFQYRTSEAYFTGGKIVNNAMTGEGRTNMAFGGGGIYINGYGDELDYFHNGKVYIKNVIIRDNNAQYHGGGIAACPVSDTSVFAKSGAAVYGNTSSRNLAKDIYILSSNLYGAHSGHPEYFIAESMLGGVPYHWKDDDGNEFPLNKLKGRLENFGDELSLHTDEVGNATTEALASVIISGNTSATRGGGIGSNGTVIIGDVELTEISLQKVWEDNNNEDNTRPESIEVELWRKTKDGSEDVYIGSETVVPDEDGNWNLTFDKLVKKDGTGEDYIYYVKEKPVSKYITKEITGDPVEGYVLTNIPKDTVKTSIPVSKVWIDTDNQDGLRPVSITVKLLADGVETEHELTLNEGNNWSGEFVELPVYKGDEEIEYTVTEGVVEGYEADITYDPETGFTITNKHVPEVVAIEGAKTWNDDNDRDRKRPESITVNLLANGEVVKTVVVTAEDEWKWSFTDLPKYEAGETIVYTITEEPVEGYTTEIDGYNVTNAYTPEVIALEGAKSWDDADNQDGKRPESITVNLLANGEVVKTVVVTAEDEWKWSFTDLPKYEAGETIAYTITEEPVEGYTTEIDGMNVTNIHTPEVIALEGAKTWDDADNQDGKRPESITIKLLANGEVIETVIVTAEDEWKWSFTDLPKYEAGEAIAYTITEEPVEGYTTDIDGMNITNTHIPEQINISGAKTWDDADNQDGKRPESITVNLLANGEVIETVVVTAEDDWKWSFTDLPKYEAGEVIVYTITEETVEGYTTVITDYDVTNSYVPEVIALEGAKTWDDADNQDGKRPESITINLLANGEVIETVVVTAEDDWKWSFTDLPKYEAGEAIVYTITEEAVEGYTAEVEGMNVANTYAPELINISGTKTWRDAEDKDGLRPESITVRLLANGEEVKSLVVTAEDEWKWTFTDLPKYAAGEEIVYTIAEDPVEGYTTEIDGYDITNIHEPEEPTKPSKPEKPTKPEKPDKPDKPDTPPQTGESRDVKGVVLALITLAAAVIIRVTTKRNKEQYNR